MDHVNSMLEGNADDVFLSKVCTDWGKAFPDLIRFIGLIDVQY
jgi:hypothetical protein